MRGCFGSILGLMFVASGLGQTSMADTELVAGPYPVKSGVNVDGHIFNVPIGGADNAPVIEVIHEDGVYSAYGPDQNISFSVDYNADCGRNHTRSGFGFRFRDQDGNDLEVFETTTSSPDTDLSRKTFLLPGYVPVDPDNSTAHTPFTACNQVIQTRKVEGKPVLKLLREGFWYQYRPAYETRMSYNCQKNGLGFRDTIPYSRSVSHPLFVHCVGDPDYKRNYATTSATTSASSIDPSQIQDELDRKAAETAAYRATLRVRGLLAEGSKEQRITNPVGLAAFRGLKQKLQDEEGLQLVDFEIVKRDGDPYFIGLWEKGTARNPFRRPRTLSEFNTLHEAQKNNGYIILDFETVRIDGELHFASLWSKDRGVQEVRGAPRRVFGHRSEFMDIYNAQKSENRFPVDLEVIKRDGKIAYRAVWKRFADGNGPEFMSAVPLEEFRTLRDQLNTAGKIAIDLER
ncbi:MAG: hypothetical protein AAGK66_04730, partial [Pseudomonadota bacterium]